MELGSRAIAGNDKGLWQGMEGLVAGERAQLLGLPSCLACLAQDPNPDDPLNKEAAVAFQENPRRFEMDVQRAIMHGHVINGQMFPPCKA